LEEEWEDEEEEEEEWEDEEEEEEDGMTQPPPPHKHTLTLSLRLSLPFLPRSFMPLLLPALSHSYALPDAHNLRELNSEDQEHNPKP